MATDSTADVLIVGGSHAGLAAALTLYRALHRCIIFDTHAPRNRWASPLHLTPNASGQDPEAVRQAARTELQSVAGDLVQFVDTRIEHATKRDDGLFELRDGNGHAWLGRTLLLSYGQAELLPDLDGYADRYTKGIFPCMFQFGFEQRGAASAGLLAIQKLAHPFHALRIADDGHKFAESMTIYTNGNPTLAAEVQAGLQGPGLQVDDRPIARLHPAEKESEVRIEFADGSSKVEGFLVHRPASQLDRTLSDQLGLEYGPFGEIKVNLPFCDTNVPGVYAAGDCASLMKIVPNAVAMGAYAGAGLGRLLPRRVTGNACK